jgi:hypothetical protein
VFELAGECRLSAISQRKQMTIGDQTPSQSNASTLHVANDPKSQRVAQPNNKSWYDTSLPTLHLFQKIKVLRSPVEATAHSVEMCDLQHRQVSAQSGLWPHAWV